MYKFGPCSSKLLNLQRRGGHKHKVWNYGQFQPPRGGSFLGTARASYLLLLCKSNKFNVSFKFTQFTKKRRSRSYPDPKKEGP